MSKLDEIARDMCEAGGVPRRYAPCPNCQQGVGAVIAAVFDHLQSLPPSSWINPDSADRAASSFPPETISELHNQWLATQRKLMSE